MCFIHALNFLLRFTFKRKKLSLFLYFPPFLLSNYCCFGCRVFFKYICQKNERYFLCQGERFWNVKKIEKFIDLIKENLVWFEFFSTPRVAAVLIVARGYWARLLNISLRIFKLFFQVISFYRLITSSSVKLILKRPLNQ